MPDVSGSGGSTPSAQPQLPATAGLDEVEDRTAGRGRAGACVGRGTPGRMEIHLAVHAGVHQHQPAVPRAPPGHLGVEGTAALLGVIEPDSAPKNLAAAPEFVWELSLGVYLLVKGFKPAGIQRLQADPRAVPTPHAVPTP